MCGHKNGGEIYAVKLLCGSPCNTIRVELFAARDKRYGGKVYGSGKFSAGNLFALSFLWKIENYPSHCRNSKYVEVRKAGMGLQNPETSE